MSGELLDGSDALVDGSGERPAGGEERLDGRTEHDETEGPYENSASLRLTDGPFIGPVLCRVVSMLLARANCPMDRLEDALAVCDALTVHAPAHAGDGHVALAVSVRGDTLELRVGELPEHAAGRLVRDAVLPGVGNVLERLTDALRVEPVAAGAGGAGEELVLGLAF